MAPYETKAMALAAKYKAFQELRLFPLLPMSKLPRDAGYPSLASTDPLMHETLFDVDNNTGVMLGGEDGVLVLDVDVRGGKRGLESLAKLEAKHGKLPETLVVETPTGGLHIYFRGCRARRRISVIGLHLDILGEGSFAVGPMSETPEGFYKVKHDAPIAVAPQWLIQWCLENAAVEGRKKRKKDNGESVELDNDNDIVAARAMLRSIPLHQLPVTGARNHALYALCAKLGDYGLSSEAAADLLRAEWNPRLQDPLDYDEIVATAEHANSYRQEPIGIRSVTEFDHVNLRVPAKMQLPIADNRIRNIDDLQRSWDTPDEEDEDIPDLEWVVPGIAARTLVTGFVGPGGEGKSAIAIALAHGVASGRNTWLGYPIAQHGNTLIINTENNRRTVLRRSHAVCTAEGTKRKLLPHRVALDCASGDTHGGKPFMAVLDQNKVAQATEFIHSIYGFVIKHKIALVVADPFVELHTVPENDNPQIARVVDLWRQVAIHANCAVILVHHANKMAAKDKEREASNARGASSFTAALRVQIDITPMSKSEAKEFGIVDNKERRRHSRVEVVKINDAEPEDGFWIRKESAGKSFCARRIELVPSSVNAFSKLCAILHDLVPNGEGLSLTDAYLNVRDYPDASDFFEKADGSGELSEKFAVAKLKRTFKERVEFDGKWLELDAKTGLLKRSE